MSECVKGSVDAMREIRAIQDECWRVYNEEEPYNYARKELWQSRVIYPKPFKLVQFGMAIVRKAFDVEFLSIENEQDQDAALFWKKLMGAMLSRNYANFPINFTDATGMSLAVGQSMEMIPQWIPGSGLSYVLATPWNIHRDPDAVSRKPWSGMYWIHQEYLDYHVLKDLEKTGRYQNIGAFGPGTSYLGQDPKLSPDEIARRKNMVWGRGLYRNAVLTSEFWGTVLDKKGETLLPNGTYTVAGGRVISAPKPSPYPTLRWPGVGFSTLPNLLRFDGRGLVQGIKSLWYLMNNLMSLHADHLNWMVNPMVEVDVQSLVDQSDVDLYPGKIWQTHGSQQGQQIVRVTDIKSQVSDAIAILNFYDQRHQDGGLMDYSAMGAPGYRAEVTAREAAQNLDQSMTVVGSMGKNLEDGALNAILAGAETVAINITYDELVLLMGPEVAAAYRVPVSPEHPTGLNLPQLTTGNFRVSGISALMRDQEILKNIANLVLPLCEQGKYGNIFAPYMKPFAIAKAIERRTSIVDEGCVVDVETAKRIDDAQQAAQEAQIQSQKDKEAADAALLQQKADMEAGRADMHRAKAQEHVGKAALAHAKAGAEGVPDEVEEPPGPTNFRETVSIDKLYPLLTRSEQEQILREMGITPGDIPKLPAQVEGAGLGNEPIPPAPPAAAKPKAKGAK